MKDLRKGDRYRFSLQWKADTQESTAVGAFLEKLGNKKSDFIVKVTWDYLQSHPEMMNPVAKIAINTQAVFSRVQLQEEIRSMLDAYMSEYQAGMPKLPVAEQQKREAPILDDDDINDMLDNLNIFDT